MLFVSSILLGKDVMYAVTKFFEGYYFFGKTYPVLVALIVAFVFAMFILHAVLAMRKFPGNWREYRAFMRHKKQLAHSDTSEWFVQVYTGFAMFFLGSVHLYLMLTHSGRDRSVCLRGPGVESVAVAAGSAVIAGGRIPWRDRTLPPCH